MKEPKSLEEWANMPLGKNLLPWLQGEEYRRVKRMLTYFVLNHQIRRLANRSALSPLRRRLWLVLTAPLSWRLRRKFYRFPIELWMIWFKNQFALRRSLLTGQSLGRDLEKIC
jgi:hypothetical protein